MLLTTAGDNFEMLSLQPVFFFEVCYLFLLYFFYF